MLLLLHFKEQKNVNLPGRLPVAKMEVFGVRRSDFSLKIRAIRLSAIFGIRRKVALRGEGFVWVPDLGSFLKLLEVGVPPYLGFIPVLSTLQMFESNEAVRGRLIGPKPWDRINMNFWNLIVTAMTDHGWFGYQIVFFHDKSCIDWNEAGNGREMRVHKVNR